MNIQLFKNNLAYLSEFQGDDLKKRDQLQSVFTVCQFVQVVLLSISTINLYLKELFKGNVSTFMEVKLCFDVVEFRKRLIN